ncbi:MAG: DUF2147 domain-containing protein [Methylobacterium sp.]|jgi:uncharacterized protein (DUF2147 family)|nr:DUF2147 domain-containing protein [Methylobacterium sp.]
MSRIAIDAAPLRMAARFCSASALLVAAAITSGGALADGPSAAGQWRQIDDRTGEIRSIITIVERSGSFHGRVTQIFPRPGEQPNPTCSACAGELRNAPVLGFPVLSGLKRDGQEYSGGTIIDPESGSTYRARMTLSEDGRKLEVRGFIGVSLFGRSQTWARAQ